MTLSSAPSLNPALPVSAERWTARLGGVLFALVWPTQLVTTIGIIGASSLASVAQTFHTTQVSWFTLVVILVATLATPFLIRLGDRLGRKQVMLAVVSLGLVGDVLAASAHSYALVLVGRGIAAGYGAFGALSYPAMRGAFPPRLVKSASALLASTGGLVALASSFLGAWLIDGWAYRGGLWFVAGASLLSLVLIVLLVPRTPRREAASGFDVPGGVTLGGGLSALVYAFSQGQTWGWTSTETLDWFAGGAIALIAFVLVERESANPILDLGMLRRRAVATVLVSASWGQAVAYASGTVAILLALYPSIPGVSGGLGWTVYHNAVVTTPSAAVVFLGGVTASRLLRRRVDIRLMWRLGLAVMAVGFVLMASFHADEAQLILTGCVTNLGAGTIIATAPALVVGAVSADEQSQGSGSLTMLIGLFTALFGALLFAVLSTHSTVVKGTAFYSDAGYSEALRLAGLLALGALALAMFIPQLREPEQAQDAEPALAGH